MPGLAPGISYRLAWLMAGVLALPAFADGGLFSAP
jgi:hypothetical protein